MKKLLLLSLFSVAAFAQTPACQISFGPWTDTNTTPVAYNAANTQCAYWVLTYQVTGFSAVSIELDSALGTSSGPGAFGLFSGTTVSGSNPSTSVACTTVANCAFVASGVVGWYRVRFTTHTGSGTIQGTLQGYKTYQALAGNTPVGGSGCPGTAGTPCVVDGVTASGAPPTTAPVLVAGQDGTNIQTIKTDTTGRPQVVGAAANAAALAGNPVTVCGSDGTNCRLVLVDTSGRPNVVGAAAAGAAVAGNPVLMGLYDGTNSQYAFYCPNQAAFSLAAATDVVIVAGVSAKKTYICHIDFAASAAATFTIQQGTGSTCGTGTAAISGAYPSITTFAMDYSSLGPLHSTTNANDICLHAGGASTAGGYVTYAQF